VDTLTDLNPEWLGLLRPESGEGISLDCPKCGSKHRLAAYFKNPIDGKEAAAWQKPIWERTGETFNALTLSPSLQYPCFHGWVENGKVFDIVETPMIVVDGELDKGGRPVALSPTQTIGYATQAILRAKQMLEEW
jgi:hypothetical protein